MLGKAALDEEAGDGIDDEAEELTYGEFSMTLFCALMRKLSPSAETTFIDIGSGRGQLVLMAAAGHRPQADLDQSIPSLHVHCTVSVAGRVTTWFDHS